MYSGFLVCLFSTMYGILFFLVLCKILHLKYLTGFTVFWILYPLVRHTIVILFYPRFDFVSFVLILPPNGKITWGYFASGGKIATALLLT